MFEGNPTSDQEKIAEYEGLLKTIPQIQMVSDDNVSNSQNCLCLFFSTCLYLL